jgi:hypothetical protein
VEEVEEEEDDDDDDDEEAPCDIFAIKPQGAGQLYFVREDDNQEGEGQCIGTMGSGWCKLKYSLCWQDAGDQKKPEIQDNLHPARSSSHVFPPRGTGKVTALRTVWDHDDVLVACVEFGLDRRLTQESVKRIKAALRSSN